MTPTPSPALPESRGPLSAALFDHLSGRTNHLPTPSESRMRRVDDPLADEDLQLALYACYELHYRGFDVPDDHEWDLQVLRFRAALERRMESALAVTIVDDPDVGVAEALRRVATGDPDAPSPSAHMATVGTIDQLREFAVHRSLYQLKEADGHSWAIPRFGDASRSAFIEIQTDEYGGGRPGESHAELFATTMAELGLDPAYGRYVDEVGAPTLATNNLLSLLGLHRRLLPALIGHLAVFEMTSVVPMGRYAAAFDRLGVSPAGRRFYDVHVEADQHHGPLAAHGMAERFVAEHPGSRPLLLWGAAALMQVERRFADHLLRAWTDGRTSLRDRAAARQLAA